jgi:hypothetical protein
MIQIIINDIANKVRAALLTGLSTATNAAITATDSVLVAFGKLQAQITALSSSLSNYVTTAALNAALSAYVTAVSLAATLANYLQKNAPITGATKTKITYDANGLVTAGTDATTADINDSSNRRYVTDAQQTVISNTSGSNSGDNATNSQYSGLSALITQKTGATAYITTGDITTSSNVASNITGLVATLEANKRYRIFGQIRTGCNNTGGVRFAASFPSDASTGITIFGFTTSGSVYVFTRISASDTLIGQFNQVNASSGFVYVFGEIETSATAGNIQFQFASFTNTQTSTIFELGTWLNITEL